MPWYSKANRGVRIPVTQITRILTLYQRLITGKVIDKTLFALEFDTTERSVDRDILAVRLFLSESFSNLDLIYDREQRGYRLKNLRIHQEIALGECYLLSKLLLDSRPLRTDEQAELVRILMSQLSAKHRDRALPVLQRTPEIPDRRDKTSLQLIEDLLYSIEQQDQIALHFGKPYADEPCVPYSVEFRDREAYLVALELDNRTPALFCLDDIKSYRPARHPYLLSAQEANALQNLVESVCSGTRKKYASYIYSKKKASE